MEHNIDMKKFEAGTAEAVALWEPSGCLSIDVCGDFSTAFGSAALDGRAVTLDDSFCLSIGSTPFVNLLIFMLADSGKINLPDKLDKYLPEYAHAGKISVMNLLRESSGIPDYISSKITIARDKDPAYRGMSPEQRMKTECEDAARGLPFDEIFSLIKDDELLFEPGEFEPRGSDTNRAFMGEIVRRVTGKSLFDAASELVFEPLGMRVLEGNRATTESRQIIRDVVTVGLGRVECRDSFTVTLGEMRKFGRALQKRGLLSKKMWRAALNYNEENYSGLFEGINGFDGFYVEAPLGYMCSILFSRDEGFVMTTLLCERQRVKKVDGQWRAFLPDMRVNCLEGLVTYPKNPNMQRYCHKNAYRAMQLTVLPEQEMFVADAMSSLCWALADKQRIRPFVLCEGERAVGLLLLVVDKKKKEYEIDIVLIDRRFQHRGYGRFMVEWAVDYLKKQGASKLEIGCNRNNVAARSLYESVGFVAHDVYDEGVMLKLEIK